MQPVASASLDSGAKVVGNREEGACSGVVNAMVNGAVSATRGGASDVVRGNREVGKCGGTNG